MIKTSRKTLTELFMEMNGDETATENFKIQYEYHIYPDKTVGEDEVVVAVSEFRVIQMLYEKWGDWSFSYDVDTSTGNIVQFNYANTKNAYQYLSNIFKQWYGRNVINLNNKMQAYHAIYNPIENYNGVEETVKTIDENDPYKVIKSITGKIKTNAKQKTISAQGGDIDNNGNVSSQSSWTPRQTHKETSYENENLKTTFEDTSGMVAGSGLTTADANDNYTEWENYSEIVTETGEKIDTLNRHGNLGVTTSQQMIQSELDMRHYDLISDFLEGFVKTYCFLVPSDDETGCYYCR